ncbi:MAG: LON peptidase substrate-binding domain-containing protein [Gammaproteobacteria bacterium]|nr:LON peptidase substrate-binding domain-containing protein [Gammaproteobacteria bacterium]
MPSTTIALFPLNTVLFPGGPLPLRIFEPRYLEMVSDCMKNDRPFGVCLIAQGSEAGEACIPHDYGTLARIEDWNQLQDGYLGITARGGQRFIVLETDTAANQLITADVEVLEEDDPEPGIDGEFQPLVEILQKALPQAGPLYEDMQPRWEDPNWVAYRIAELLPDNNIKLEVLQAGAPQERLALVDRYIKSRSSRQ